MSGPSFYRSIGVVIFIVFFMGALGGFIYRDSQQPKISEAERLKIMKDTVRQIQQEAERRAVRTLREGESQGGRTGMHTGEKQTVAPR